MCQQSLCLIKKSVLFIFINVNENGSGKGGTTQNDNIPRPDGLFVLCIACTLNAVQFFYIVTNTPVKQNSNNIGNVQRRLNVTFIFFVHLRNLLSMLFDCFLTGYLYCMGRKHELKFYQNHTNQISMVSNHKLITKYNISITLLKFRNQTKQVCTVKHQHLVVCF